MNRAYPAATTSRWLRDADALVDEAEKAFVCGFIPLSMVALAKFLRAVAEKRHVEATRAS